MFSLLCCCFMSGRAAASAADCASIATAVREANILTKSLSLHFTNKDLGVRCWGETLLAQRGTESSWPTFLLCRHLRQSPLLHLLKQNSSNWMSLPSISCASLLPTSYCPSLSVVSSSQVVVCSAS